MNTDDNRTLCHEPFDHDGEQSPGNGTGAPMGTIEDLVIGRKVGSMGSAGHAQARRNGPFARGQQAAHHKNKYMLPTGRSKAEAP